MSQIICTLIDFSTGNILEYKGKSTFITTDPPKRGEKIMITKMITESQMDEEIGDFREITVVNDRDVYHVVDIMQNIQTFNDRILDNPRSYIFVNKINLAEEYPHIKQAIDKGWFDELV